MTKITPSNIINDCSFQSFFFFLVEQLENDEDDIEVRFGKWDLSLPWVDDFNGYFKEIK